MLTRISRSSVTDYIISVTGYDDEIYLLDGGDKSFEIIAEISKGIYDAVEMSKDI